MEYFLAVVEAGSITRAAARLGVAQPSLSQQLLILEREFGARLLDRTPGGVALTVAGENLATRARAIVRELAALRGDLLRPATSLSGSAAVGLLPSVSQALGARLIAQCRRDHPAIRLKVMEDSSPRLNDALLQGELDFATSASRPADDRLITLTSFSEPLLVVCSPGRFEAPPNLEELATQDWIVPPPPNAMHKMLMASFASLGLEPQVACEVDSMSIIIAAIEEGCGLSLLPLSAVRAVVEAGRVATVDSAPSIERTLHLCARRDAELSPVGAAVSALLARLMDEQIGRLELKARPRC